MISQARYTWHRGSAFINGARFHLYDHDDDDDEDGDDDDEDGDDEDEDENG